MCQLRGGRRWGVHQLARRAALSLLQATAAESLRWPRSSREFTKGGLAIIITIRRKTLIIITHKLLNPPLLNPL